MTHVARCPEHGLHGERTECFECGGPVEQVPVVTLPAVLPELEFQRDQAIATLALRKRITLQGAANELAEVMKSADPVIHHLTHGPGPTVPGHSTHLMEREK